ncbi:hypothetical protein DQ04_00141000 [Trypanosoma grayi]|uniref:hypothetical protein n=1 Tax=Trypanosoma grayi TaxID=71804 RepID=UPI0004F4A855|nr:hypothetical protein DQ04_00141000 [Trypanosoma grayi]KEG15212.1 hypothetical protein DQ04_00141000 [Trypanosoma grayi]
MTEKSATFAEVVAGRLSIAPVQQDIDSVAPTAATAESLSPAPHVGTTFFTNVRPPGGESYADAVKSGSVKLDGVPVNPLKLVGFIESVTNSTMQEQESVLSSWADDDQCFFDSIRIAQEEQRKPQESQRDTGRQERDGDCRREHGGRRWRFIGGGESSRNNNNNRRRRGNNRGNFRRAGGAEPPVLSGGRFAALR